MLVLINQMGREHEMLLDLQLLGSNNDIPFGTNEFSKVKEKQVAGCLFSL
jgi:hypothetical protein